MSSVKTTTSNVDIGACVTNKRTFPTPTIPLPPGPPPMQPPKKKTRQIFGKNVYIAAKDFTAPTAMERRMRCHNRVFNKKHLKEWIDEIILDDFVVNGTTSKFKTLEEFKKLAIPILEKMGELVNNYEIEIVKYSDFQKILRKASLGECFSEAESDDEDSPSDDDVEDM